MPSGIHRDDVAYVILRLGCVPVDIIKGIVAVPSPAHVPILLVSAGPYGIHSDQVFGLTLDPIHFRGRRDEKRDSSLRPTKLNVSYSSIKKGSAEGSYN